MTFVIIIFSTVAVCLHFVCYFGCTCVFSSSSFFLFFCTHFRLTTVYAVVVVVCVLHTSIQCTKFIVSTCVCVLFCVSCSSLFAILCCGCSNGFHYFLQLAMVRVCFRLLSCLRFFFFFRDFVVFSSDLFHHYM